jgi:acetylornithine deacetylase/succinyl-diaminopimelate desuccinylase-like protein
VEGGGGARLRQHRGVQAGVDHAAVRQAPHRCAHRRLARTPDEVAEKVLAVRMQTLPGFETAVFPYTTDVPLLTRWGAPLLLGPGSIHVAHTDEEHVAIDDLEHAVELYTSMAKQLLQ